MKLDYKINSKLMLFIEFMYIASNSLFNQNIICFLLILAIAVITQNTLMHDW
mgnify:CR=1 FL=1